VAAHLLRRLLATIGVLFSMSILIFAVVHILPGNVAYAMLGEFATPDKIAVLEARLGLNDPLWLQYWRWFDGMLHGDLGPSLVMARPAGPLIADALGHSAILAGCAFVLVAVCGIALGIYSAANQGRTTDRLATLAQFILGWAAHLVLPVLVLTCGLVAHVSRLTRSSMIEVLRSRYVLAARAKGFSNRRVLWRHALPNALLPAITILAVDLGLLMGGIVVIETVFAYPGLGRLLVFAIEHHDLPLLQAGMMVVTAAYAFANLAADLCYAVLNPRIRVGSAVA
jgi:peptide/nickel transport system permease protein